MQNKNLALFKLQCKEYQYTKKWGGEVKRKQRVELAESDRLLQKLLSVSSAVGGDALICSCESQAAEPGRAGLTPQPLPSKVSMQQEVGGALLLTRMTLSFQSGFSEQQQQALVAKEHCLFCLLSEKCR